MSCWISVDRTASDILKCPSECGPRTPAAVVSRDEMRWDGVKIICGVNLLISLAKRAPSPEPCSLTYFVLVVPLLRISRPCNNQLQG